MFAPAVDCCGRQLSPGDCVSFKKYPRGTARGVVIISERVFEPQPDGSRLPALSIRCSDGCVYSLNSRGVRKLASQSKEVP